MTLALATRINIRPGMVFIDPADDTRCTITRILPCGDVATFSWRTSQGRFVTGQADFDTISTWTRAK